MSLETACEHYCSLKNLMRAEVPDDLEWYEHSDKQGWHYESITYDNYLRLFYRVVWSAGFRAQTVFDKEEAYFTVLYTHLFPQGRYDPSQEQVFLDTVAHVLGKHSANRKNQAIAHLIRLIESHGWEEFRKQYISPSEGLETKLLDLPMIGPKTVKLLLNQPGIVDTAKDDVWVTRFSERHGFEDPLECVRLVAERLGDDQTTIDAVLFWAGRNYGLNPRK